MKFKVYRYKQGKLFLMFNNKEFTSVSDMYQSIKWWYEVTRNDQSTEFIAINTEDDTIYPYIINRNLITFYEK